MKQQKRLKNRIDGWLVLDKPQGMTSTEAVTFIKKLWSPEKVGHAGTLDPLATGILPIALGEATKTVAYAMEGMKTYSFTVRWGIERDTDDAEGQVTQTSELRPTIEDIETILSQFCGNIQQIPPQFSAIKVQGERAYDIARTGEAVELKSREVYVESLKISDMPDEETTVFHCQCGKGTYVRSLARDLGRVLGCFGHVIALRRTRVGSFVEKQAFKPSELAEIQNIGQTDTNTSQNLENRLDNPLLPVAAVLDDIPALTLTRGEADRLRNGQPILLRGQNAPHCDGAAYATCSGELIALGQLGGGQFSPTRVFRLKGYAAAVPHKIKEYTDVDYA
jgi:tRNA pseudouridine55 synthase